MPKRMAPWDDRAGIRKRELMFPAIGIEIEFDNSLFVNRQGCFHLHVNPKQSDASVGVVQLRHAVEPRWSLPGHFAGLSR